jgi:hypothetical protein
MKEAGMATSGLARWRGQVGPLRATNKLDPAILSAELREGRHGYLKQRRALAGVTLGAMGALGVVALYQLGLIKRLPDVPLPMFDATQVDAAAEAYATLAMPNSVLKLGSYAVTLALVAAGGQNRVRRHPWLPLALAAKGLGLDLPVAARGVGQQWVRHRAFCVWSLAAGAASAISAVVALPEAWAALGRLWRGVA